MAINDTIRRAGDRIDRTAGKLAYRLAGFVIACFGLGAGAAALAAFGPGGSPIAGTVFLGVAGGAIWLAQWCFQPERRLSDMED